MVQVPTKTEVRSEALIIVSAKEANKNGTGKYILLPCIDCGKERWVQFRRTPWSPRCASCAHKGERSER